MNKLYWSILITLGIATVILHESCCADEPAVQRLGERNAGVTP